MGYRERTFSRISGDAMKSSEGSYFDFTNYEISNIIEHLEKAVRVGTHDHYLKDMKIEERIETIKTKLLNSSVKGMEEKIKYIENYLK